MADLFKIVLLVLAMFLVLFLLYQEQLKEPGKKNGQSPNAIVRKMYKKKIKSGIKSKIPYWATPYELKVLAQWQKKGSESMLHMLYEKARYSKEGCLKEDLDRYMSTEENYRQ